MEGGKLQDRKLSSVKAAIASTREQNLDGNPAKEEFHTKYSKKPYTKTKELHQAKKAVKGFTRRSEIQDLEKIKMAKRREEERNQFENVMKEVESIKQELSKLKLGMASILEEERRAVRETDLSMSKARSYSSAIEAFTKEIEKMDEEHVLVELARVEAIKECREVAAQRREDAGKQSIEMEETQRKKQSMIREIEDAKELETRLAITISDINVLESKLKQAEEMEKRLGRNESQRYQIKPSFHESHESGSASLLESITRELEAAKKELTSVEAESFEFKASMDVIRDELSRIVEEAATFKKKEEKADMVIRNLNTKLLRAKAKLEAACAAADDAKSTVSNVSLTLEQIKSECETAEKERSLISEESALTNAEVQNTETEIELAEERLQAALQDLKAVKSSEAVALENLQAIFQKTMRNRAASSKHRATTITISKFEYDYLKGHAAGATEIADKKVSAAEAWIEALKASEKEIMMKIDVSRRESRELRVETEGAMTARRYAEDDRRAKQTPARRAKVRKPAASSTVGGSYRSASFGVRRRKLDVPIAKIQPSS